MSQPFFSNPMDDKIYQGYRDALDNAPPPSSSDHPGYVLGYLNGRDDKNHAPRKSADEIRADLAYIEAVLAD